MKKSKQYTVTPAKGQALLNFHGRRFPDTVSAFEIEMIEEITTRETNKQLPYNSEENALNSDFRNQLIQGDCLSACAYLLSRNIKVDLVYIDPPFASGANYAKKIHLRNGGKSPMEMNNNTIGEEVMYGDIWQKEDYLNWLYERLLVIREVMNETASIYVHLDWHIGHYVKILLDEVYGEENFRNEIIWKYTGSLSPKYDFARKHDNIFRYSKSNDVIYNPLLIDYNKDTIKRFDKQDDNGRYKITYRNDKEYKTYMKNGKTLEDTWDDLIDESIVMKTSNEYVDYITQKPEALLDRIIKASSNEGMIIADFFSGSGTTAKVAHDLKRQFIACDIGINAVQTTRDRLAKAGADFDMLKIKDGLRLFRNPTQTMAKIFSLIDGFKSRTELDLSSFWDGGIAAPNGSYTLVKCVGIHDLLTFNLLGEILEEIYKLEDSTNNVSQIMIIYAHKEDDLDQSYLTKISRTEQKIELISLDKLLAEKRDVMFTPDNAIIEIQKQGSQCRVEIRKFFSSYLFKKIEDYNEKKINGGTILQYPTRAVKISNSGLEMIEAIQFDTTLGKVWKSNPLLEDKAGIKHKIKGLYILNTDKFKLKIRNIAGDEIIIDSEDIGK